MESLQIALSTIDEEHRLLERLTGDLSQGLSDGLCDHMKSLYAMRKLVTLLQKHFANEERIMAEVNYPQSSQHTLAHHTISAELYGMISSFVVWSLPSSENIGKIFSQRISAQINDHDRDLLAFLERLAVAASPPDHAI